MRPPEIRGEPSAQLEIRGPIHELQRVDFTRGGRGASHGHGWEKSSFFKKKSILIVWNQFLLIEIDSFDSFVNITWPPGLIVSLENGSLEGTPYFKGKGCRRRRKFLVTCKSKGNPAK